LDELDDDLLWYRCEYRKVPYLLVPYYLLVPGILLMYVPVSTVREVSSVWIFVEFLYKFFVPKLKKPHFSPLFGEVENLAKRWVLLQSRLAGLDELDDDLL
jgi:hypothetical protein